MGERMPSAPRAEGESLVYRVTAVSRGNCPGTVAWALRPPRKKYPRQTLSKEVAAGNMNS